MRASAVSGAVTPNADTDGLQPSEKPLRTRVENGSFIAARVGPEENGQNDPEPDAGHARAHHRGRRGDHSGATERLGPEGGHEHEDDVERGVLERGA